MSLSTLLMMRLNQRRTSVCTSHALAPGVVIEGPPQSPRGSGPLGYGRCGFAPDRRRTSATFPRFGRAPAVTDLDGDGVLTLTNRMPAAG